MVMEAKDAANTAGAAAAGRGINVTVQYLQVYQDNVFDLLGGRAGTFHHVFCSRKHHLMTPSMVPCKPI
jgi:hypothetical protein